MKPIHDSDGGVPKKSSWRPLAKKKLPCHVDFPLISLIALFLPFMFCLAVYAIEFFLFYAVYLLDSFYVE